MAGLREAIEGAITTEESSAPSAVAEPAAVAAAPSAVAETAAPSPATPERTGSEPESRAAAAEQVPAESKPKSIETVVAEKTSAPAAEQDKDQSPDRQAGASRVDRAPASWKGDAKKLWEAIPLEARQEVIRREKQVTHAMSEVAAERRNFQQVSDVIAPHMDRINAMYQGNPVAAINNLMRVEQILTSASTMEKANFVAGMIKRFNIDVNMLDEALSGQMTPQARQQGELASLIDQKMAPLQQLLLQQQQDQANRAQQSEAEMVHSIETAVARMGEDSENFPYFEDVREDMADLMELSAKRGVSLSFEQAYTKAVALNDRVQQSSTGRDHAQAATNAALAAHQAAQRAKGAAVSVSGSPTGTGGNAGNPADLRGMIASAFDGGLRA